MRKRALLFRNFPLFLTAKAGIIIHNPGRKSSFIVGWTPIRVNGGGYQPSAAQACRGRQAGPSLATRDFVLVKTLGNIFFGNKTDFQGLILMGIVLKWPISRI
jgi:hypothetical protein